MLFQSLGYQKAAQLLFESNWISGTEYFNLGLAKYVGDDFIEQAFSYAYILNDKSLSSIVETKAILKTFIIQDIQKARELENLVMKKLFGSADNLNAIDKFFSKKK